jgi:hypothetical protein
MRFLTKENARVGMRISLNPAIEDQISTEEAREHLRGLVIAEIPDKSEYKAKELIPGVFHSINTRGAFGVWVMLKNGKKGGKLLVLDVQGVITPTFFIVDCISKDQKTELENLVENLKNINHEKER